MVTEAAGQNSQTGEARTAGHVSGLAFVKVLMMEHLRTNHHHGQDFIEPKIKVNLVKEPENEYDTEAIKVEMPDIGHMGYVANSTYTVVGESYSEGRLYNKIGDTVKGTVRYVLPKEVLCVLNTVLVHEVSGMYRFS